MDPNPGRPRAGRRRTIGARFFVAVLVESAKAQRWNSELMVITTGDLKKYAKN
jgi:hypothetical protein